MTLAVPDVAFAGFHIACDELFAKVLHRLVVPDFVQGLVGNVSEFVVVETARHHLSPWVGSLLHKGQWTEIFR